MHDAEKIGSTSRTKSGGGSAAGETRRDSAAERERGRERHDERNGKPGAAPHGQTEFYRFLLARRRRLRASRTIPRSDAPREAHA
jgi:hypothetical protein